MLGASDNQSGSNLGPDHFLVPQTISLGANPTGTPSGIYSSGTSSPLNPEDSTHPVDTSTLASADFDVDVQSGFLPPSAPLKRLSDPEFDPWESALDWIQSIISKLEDEQTREQQIQDELESWKAHVVSKMGILKIDGLLMDMIELRRAHLVLAFLTHAFVHSDSLLLKHSVPDDQVSIPPALAIPFSQISHALDLPPVLTYADTVLYNWYFKNPALGFTVSNIEINTTFTQTESEKHFYKTSVLVEALGPECLRLMRSSLDEAFMGDSIAIKRIGINLGKLSKQIDCISKVLGEVRAGCDPKTFYWDIRPWFNAGKWVWEGVDPFNKSSEPITSKEEDKERIWRVTEFGGPSAGQSTLIHALDVFLGINHEPNQQEIEQGIQLEETFMKKMSAYMPHHHRLFLQHLSQSCFIQDTSYSKKSHLIRSMVMNNENNNEKLSLKENYNSCINSLTNLRNTHTIIASLFIISQKNSKNFPSSCSNSLVKPPLNSIKQEITTKINDQPDNDTGPICCVDGKVLNANDQVLRGTGGTDLSKFLKRCKLRTCQALVLDD